MARRLWTITLFVNRDSTVTQIGWGTLADCWRWARDAMAHDGGEARGIWIQG